MNHLFIIVPIVILIIVFQLQFFSKGRQLIKTFKSLFVSDVIFEKVTISVPEGLIESCNPRTIIENISQYEGTNHDNCIEIVLIKQSNADSLSLSAEIIDNINIYLLRNKGAISDFNMIRDIVNRYSDSVEEEIQTVLPVPLYLGLIGTMTGIIVGLVVVDTNNMNALMWGVSVAMFASAVGLFCTTWNSGWLLKAAKSSVETNKNRFFTFVQTELLPIFNKDATSSIYALQGYLSSFNEKFEANIFNFSGLLDKILVSFDNQVEVIRELKQLDIKSIQQFNVTVLKELKSSIGELERFSKSAKEFERFGEYIIQLNRFIDITFQLSNSIDNQLKRSSQIGVVIDNINDNVVQSSKILGYLESHYKTIEDRDDVIRQAVSSVDTTLENCFGLLERHSQEKVEAIHRMAVVDNETLKIINDSSLQHIETFSQKVSAALFDIGENVAEKVRAISSVYIDEKEGIHEMFRDEFAKLVDVKNGFDSLCGTIVEISQSQCQELRALTIQQQQSNDVLIEKLIVSNKENCSEIETLIKDRNEVLFEDQKGQGAVYSVSNDKSEQEMLTMGRANRFDTWLRRVFYIIGIVAFLLIILVLLCN